VKVREAGDLAVGEQPRLKVVADGRGEGVETSGVLRAADPAEAAASVARVWWWSVTVQPLQRCSRIRGSAGWSESFQSPWP
jgi:hypothetical protein